MAQMLALVGLTSLLVSLLLLRLPALPSHAQTIASCPPNVDKTAFPTQILLGEPVQIRLSLWPQPECQREVLEERPLHIVVAIDVSGSMAGTDVDQMKNLAGRFVESMKLAEHPATRIAIVSFSDRSREHCALSNDPQQLEICIREVGAQLGHTTDIGVAINKAERILVSGRNLNRAIRPAQAIALLSDGGDPNCDQVRIPQGIHLAAVCTTQDCNKRCMLDHLASGGSASFLDSGQQDELAQIFTPLQIERVKVISRDIRITDTLPIGYTVVDNTIDPKPSYRRIGSNGQETLIWRFDALPATGMNVSFQARPSRLGMQAANQHAEASVRDNLGITARVDFPIPYISVLGPASPTPPATPTGLPTAVLPTAAPTLPVEPTPSARPLPPRIFRVWVPLALGAPWNEG